MLTAKEARRHKLEQYTYWRPARMTIRSCWGVVPYEDWVRYEALRLSAGTHRRHEPVEERIADGRRMVAIFGPRSVRMPHWRDPGRRLKYLEA